MSTEQNDGRSQSAMRWRETFLRVVREPEYAEPLQVAAHVGDKTRWTAVLTGAVVSTCGVFGWEAAGKGHRLAVLPEARDEYLTLDVLAFPPATTRWRFPIAAIELENVQNPDRIAYSLWKVLCVRVGLRLVYCYRQQPEEGTALVRTLTAEVIGALDPLVRQHPDGATLVVVGSHADAGTFPYGFFTWWQLDTTGTFRRML
jgi:hypothetical protein